MLNILFKLFCFFLALNLLTYNWIKKIINKSIFIIYDKRKKIINYFLIILLLCPSIAISISTFDIVNWLRYGKLTFVLNDLNELSLDKLSKLNISELITDLFVWVIAFPIFFPIFFIILIILLNKKLELVAFISKWAIVAHLWITSYWCVSTLRIISSELGKELNVDSKDILYSNTFFNLKRFFNSEELKKLTELYVGSDYIKDNEFIKMLNDFLTSHPGVGWGELKIKVMEFVAIVDASKIAANQAAHDSVVMTWIGGFFIIMVSVFMFKKSGLIEYLNPYRDYLEAYNVLTREMLKLRVDHELLRLLLGDLQENMDDLKIQFDDFSSWATRCIYNLATGYQMQQKYLFTYYRTLQNVARTIAANPTLNRPPPLPPME